MNSLPAHRKYLLLPIILLTLFLSGCTTWPSQYETTYYSSGWPGYYSNWGYWNNPQVNHRHWNRHHRQKWRRHHRERKIKPPHNRLRPIKPVHQKRERPIRPPHHNRPRPIKPSISPLGN